MSARYIEAAAQVSRQ